MRSNHPTKTSSGLAYGPERPLLSARRSSILVRCTRFGVGYGATLGGSYGLLWATGIVLRFGMPPGNPLRELLLLLTLLTASGSLLGAIGGVVCGLVSSRARRPSEWSLVGALGGVLAGLMPLAVLLSAGGPADASWGPLFCLVLPALVGGAIGAGVGRGIETGQSRLPHVETLATAIREADAERQHARLAAGSHEVAPAAAPEGGGEEIIPAPDAGFPIPRQDLTP